MGLIGVEYADDTVELEFMVDPKQLLDRAYVRDGVRCRILKPDLIHMLGSSWF